MKKFNLEDMMYDIADKYPKSIPILNHVFDLIFRIGLAVKRISCVIEGCDEERGNSWNMPDDYNPPVYCKRCGACHDVYNIETTPWPLIYKGDGFMTALSEWLEWNK
jgi:hypothetical protein